MTFWAWFFAITTVGVSIGFLITLFNSGSTILDLEETVDTYYSQILSQQKQIASLSKQCMEMAREIHTLTYTTGHPETINSILCRYEKKGDGI